MTTRRMRRLRGWTALALLAGGATGLGGAAAASAAAPSVGQVYVSLPQSAAPRLISIAQNGGAAQPVDGTWSEPLGLATDAAGNLYVADGDQVSIARTDGSVEVVQNVLAPYDIDVDGRGDLFVVSVNLNTVTRYPAGGGAGVQIGTSIASPGCVGVSPAGDAYVCGTGRVVKIPADGGPDVEVGGPFANPSDVVVGTDGDVFVSDVQAGTISRIPADGGPTVAVVTGLAAPTSFAVGADGGFWVALFGSAPDTGSLERIDPDGTRTTLQAPLSYPQSVAISAPAPVFLDSVPPRSATVGQPYSYTHRVSAVDPGSTAPVFRVASGALPPGLSLDPATGALSGTPTTAGVYRFAVQVGNAAKAVVADTATIEVSAAPVADPGTTPATPQLAASGAPPVAGAVVLGILACASGAGAMLVSRHRRRAARTEAAGPGRVVSSRIGRE